jgi:SAM-dependent methyltransferase
MDKNDTAYKGFYNTINREEIYTTSKDFKEHPAYPYIKKFISTYALEHGRCLEIGSSRGLFQDMVIDYTAIDVSDNLKKYYHKPYFVTEKDEKYPFPDNTFDAIWTWAVFEHIPELNQSLLEMIRVLKPHGLVLFAPAWYCRSWATEGYPVRPYSDFDIVGKLIKFSIPLRNSLVYRSLKTFPKRLVNHILFSIGFKPKKIHFIRLKPNYTHFWMSDSDACNSIDPHDAILWFENHGMRCISHTTFLKKILFRYEPIILRKNKVKKS